MKRIEELLLICIVLQAAVCTVDGQDYHAGSQLRALF
jgi:hypothetical protein